MPELGEARWPTQKAALRNGGGLLRRLVNGVAGMRALAHFLFVHLLTASGRHVRPSAMTRPNSLAHTGPQIG